MILLLHPFVSGCRKNQTIAMKDKIGLIKQHKISLPLERMKRVCNRSTGCCIPKDRSLKIVAYSDSMACSSCAVDKLYTWLDMIKKTEPYGEKINYNFIFCPKKEERENVEFAIKTLAHFNYPVYVDTLGLFEGLNPQIPHIANLHTFFLDENNNVLLVGNPINNKKIEKLFWQIVEEKLGKRE